jgi:MFS family permease
MYIAAA